MGGFYGSIQVRAEERDAVLNAVKTLVSDDRQFLVGPQLDGWVAVYPRGNGQDISVAVELAARLSMPLIHLLVHDDDIFAYEAYAHGATLDSYNSRPDYFGPVDDAERERVRGCPERLAPFARNPTPHAIAEVLEAGRQGEHEPAYLLLERFAALLGVRNAVTSFEYLERGEREGIVGWRKFTRVPDNRAAARAAATAVKQAWAELERRGVITLRDGQFRVKAVFAAAHGALLSLRGGIPFGSGHVPGRVEQWSAPWKSSEPVLTTRLDMAHNLSADSSGRWLATGHAYGEWHARIWDRGSSSLAFEIQHTQMVHWTGFTADGGYVVSLGPELIVTDLATGDRVGASSRGIGGRTAVIDDSRGLVAVAPSDGLSIFQLPRLTPICEIDTEIRNQAEHAFAMCLDVTGDHLVVATSEGLRVYSWTAAIAGGRTTLKAVHAFSMPFVYAAVLDGARRRVLYGGLDGTLAALDLATGVARTLLTLPGETTIFQLVCSPGSNALAMSVGSRPTEDRKPWSALVVVDLATLD